MCVAGTKQSEKRDCGRKVILTHGSKDSVHHDEQHMVEHSNSCHCGQEADKRSQLTFSSPYLFTVWCHH